MVLPSLLSSVRFLRPLVEEVLDLLVCQVHHKVLILILHHHKYLHSILLNDGERIEADLAEEKQDQELKIYKRGDLLKMHAYKDAIRRTSGAYILYPGTVQRRLKGFHEIIPGLGAFCLTPCNSEEELITLQVFLLKIVEHMLDRTSQRERMSYHMNKVYNTPSKQIQEQIRNGEDLDLSKIEGDLETPSKENSSIICSIVIFSTFSFGDQPRSAM